MTMQLAMTTWTLAPADHASTVRALPYKNPTKTVSFIASTSNQHGWKQTAMKKYLGQQDKFNKIHCFKNTSSLRAPLFIRPMCFTALKKNTTTEQFLQQKDEPSDGFS